MDSINLDNKILELKDEIIKSVQGIIRIKSVEEKNESRFPFGLGVHNSLLYCLKLSEELGFKTKNIDNMVGYAEYGEGDELIAVLGHLDVVPEGDGWIYPPYGGEIHDDKIYGRGAIDDKGPIIAALYALKAIKDVSLTLKRRVRIIFGLNEESGSACVKHYVSVGEEMPVAGFTPDAEYPIINGEKGIVGCKYVKKMKPQGQKYIKSINGGIASNVVPDYAKAEIAIPENMIKQAIKLAENREKVKVEASGNGIIVEAFGLSAHGSTPEKGINAISVLTEFLSLLNLDGTSGELIDFINKYIGRDTRGKLMGIYMHDDISGDFILNMGVISGDENEVGIVLNMRYPVTKRYEDFIDKFKSVMELNDMEEIFIKNSNSLYIPADTDFIKKLRKVYEEKTGDVGEPICIGGGTYAKSMKNVVAFGPIFKGEPEVEHKPNEYIKIDSLMKNVQIMAAAIYELAN